MSDFVRSPDETVTQFDALAHERRRGVLGLLEGSTQPISLADLATELARQETGHEEIGSECDRAKQIQQLLYHWHVPKLADAGLVEYDQDQRVVKPVEAGITVDTRAASQQPESAE